MSAVIAEPAAVVAPTRSGKRKLIVILAAVLLLVAVGGGGAVFYLKKRAAAAAAAAEAEADGESPAAEHAAADKHSLVPPTYLPLDPFVVNLADRDSDRYAQIGITLEVQDPAFADRMKAYMPAVRNAILMTITRKTSRELLDPNGKELLAEQIRREAVRPMGIEVSAPDPVTPAASEPAASAPRAAAAGEDEESTKPKKKPAKKKAETVKNPVQQVNFSSFIIQ